MKKTFLIVVFTLNVLTVSAWATTRYVPSQYSTIQSAINACSHGDTVLVADGIYRGAGNRDIDFHGKAITVQSENGPEFTIVDCQGGPGNEHRGFYFHNNETANSILDGFTITNGYGLYSSRGGAGNGLYCSYSSPTIKNCIITDGKSHEGIFCFGHNGTCNPTFINCIIANNKNGGIASRYDCNLTFINCTITGNKRGYGAGIYMYAGCNATLINCLLTGNQASSVGGGIYIRGGNLTVTNSTISDNSAGTGGGIYCYCTGNTTVANTILWGNTASQGTQIAQSVNSWCQGSTVTVSYSDVQGGEVAVYVGSRCKLRWYEGNIDSDPLFVYSGNDDYHLLPGSPCIDAGDNNNVPDDTTDLDGDGNTTEPIPWDLDGNARVVDGDNDGNSVVDMGAYEANYVQVQMKFTPQAVNPGSQGNWFKLHFVLPEGFGVEDVDVNKPALCRLMDTDGVAESVDMNIFINEEDLVEVEVAFDRGAFSLCSSGQAERNAGVLGLLAGTGGQYFYGTDSIKIINKTWEHLAGLASHWLGAGCGEPDWCGGADLNQDSVVNFLDFAMFDACCIEIITE